jgi:hypothetical protein
MARKTLLTEAEIRKFMKLANISPMNEMGMGMDLPGARDEEEEEEEPGMRDYMQEQEEEEEMDMDAEEGDMEMDVEMAAEEPAEEPVEEPADAMDMEMDDDMGMDDAMDMDGDKEEQFADIVNQLAELVGVVADVGFDGEEEMEGEVEAEEGGDLEMADSALEDEEEVEMGEEEMIAEVARRVKARLLNERKKDAMATKLADRIFNRLVSK